jgi:hypothetical protein
MAPLQNPRGQRGRQQLLDSLRLTRARVAAALSGHAVIVKRLSCRR